MAEKDIKRRKWLWCNRANDTSSSFIGNSVRCLQGYFSCLNKARWKGGRKYWKGFGVRVLGQKGISSLEFLIYFNLIVFVLFAGVDYFAILSQIQAVEHKKNFYLDRVKVEGTLTDCSRDELSSDLEGMGLKNVEIATRMYSGAEFVEFHDDVYVYRNVVNPNDSLIELIIKTEPKVKPFLFEILLGSSKDKIFYIEKRGLVFSERPRPGQ